MKINKYNVIPNLPESLEPLREIALNLWSTWNWQAGQLFIRLDSETWEKCNQNPVKTLARVSQARLNAAASDESFVAALDRVWQELNSYLNAPTWFEEASISGNEIIAYFSMEFGLDVGLPIYSGGLGVLAGDHLKSSSDLGLPLIAVGLLYQRGYFQQHLDSNGWQKEKYVTNDWYNMPVTLQRDSKDNPLTIKVNTGVGVLKAQVWKVVVGRISLYLLDTNIPENPSHLRQVTAQLYGGDRETRILQEILLGIGGVRALKALGINPTVFHMNEGHSAFLALERARQLMTDNEMNFEEAWEIIFASTVFTTHTPVSAGNESFSLSRMKKHFDNFAKELNISWENFLELGLEPGIGDNFSLTILALKMSAHCNGVSRLHGKVSREMWQSLWQGLPIHEIPIGHITNGIHTRTWISPDMNDLMLRYFGPQFIDEPQNQEHWERVKKIPDAELWRIHQIHKDRLISFTRKRLKNQLERRSASISEIQRAGQTLNSEVLTIGFARRFATYKRANLILDNPERFIRLLTNKERPIQFIFAGKAHPHDDDGKEYIRRLIEFLSEPEIRQSIAFIEDYDMNVGKYLTQGVDVWLSNPRRPLEASGTSGMKAAANGVLNLSTLDGWWDEAYDHEIGWAIGSGEMNGNPEELDKAESKALLDLLEEDIIPAFYEVNKANLRHQWIKMMKNSMRIHGKQFNTHRMVMEYNEKLYQPAHEAGMDMSSDRGRKARSLCEWRSMIDSKWAEVSIHTDGVSELKDLISGSELSVESQCRLHGISPDHVAVEVYYGTLNEHGIIDHGNLKRLDFDYEKDGISYFRGSLSCELSGRQGFAVRIRPDHSMMVHPWTPFRFKWE